MELQNGLQRIEGQVLDMICRKYLLRCGPALSSVFSDDSDRVHQKLGPGSTDCAQPVMKLLAGSTRPTPATTGCASATEALQLD